MESVLESCSQGVKKECAEGEISVSKPGASGLLQNCHQPIEESETSRFFRKLWGSVTDDNPLTLFGFRRFRTTHLLNLRLLEEEIDQLDHKIFQAGLNLGMEPTNMDKLGLKDSKRDKSAPSPEEALDPDLVSKLRQLLKDYGKSVVNEKLEMLGLTGILGVDDGLTSFNQIMMMETFALADNSWQAKLRSSNHNPYEIYKTRLVRLDTMGRSRSGDFLRRGLRKYLRAFWFFLWTGGRKSPSHSPYYSATALESNLKRSYQNTSRIADIIARLVVALLTGAFLVVPLVILSRQSTNEAHLITISVCIVMFSSLVSLLSNASNEETMVASAAYAAVLSVFFTNNSAQ